MKLATLRNDFKYFFFIIIHYFSFYFAIIIILLDLFYMFDVCTNLSLFCRGGEGQKANRALQLFGVCRVNNC